MMMMLTMMMRVPRNHDAMLRSRNARARTTTSGTPSALSRRKRGGKSSRVSTPPSSIGMGGSKPKTTTGRRRDDSDDTEENPSGGETQTTRRTFVLLASASVASASETARADAKENNIFDEFPDEERNGDEASCGVKSLIVGPGFGEFESVSKALLASAEEGGATIEIKSGTYKERIIVNKKNVRLIGLSEDVVVEWRTPMPYESVLEVTSENVSVENVKFTHASKSVANNFGAFVKEGGSLMLNNVSITSETGSGLATEGGSIDAENVKIYKCKNHGVSAFGNQLEEPKSGRVTLENVAISNCGGDGILLRGGVEVDSRDVKIDNCAGFGIEAFENVQGAMKACKISKCKKGNVGGDNDNYDGNGVSIELV